MTTQEKLIDRPAFIWLLFSIVTYAWVSYICALLSIFYPVIVFGAWIAILIAAWKIAWLPKFRLTKSFNIAVFGLILTIIALLLISMPSVFEGRDQGSIANAAILLSQDHGPFHRFHAQDIFYRIYGEGKALNFPGFVYSFDGALTTQFPLPYIAFIAGLYSIYGMTGFAAANAILLFTSGLTLWAIGQYLLTKRSSRLWLLALFLGTFSTIFFAKFTLSENLACLLFFSSILFALRIRSNLTKQSLILFALSTGLLFFVRIEGLLLAPLAWILVLRWQHVRASLTENIWSRIVYPLSAFSLVGLTALIVNFSFYKGLAGVFFKESAEGLSLGKSPDLSEIYLTYGILVFLVLTAAAAIYCIIKKQSRFYLLPLTATLPLFVYYLDPQITLDAPWMLRRFSWGLIPITILYSVWLVETLSHRRNAFVQIASHTFLGCLLAYQLATTMPHLTYSDHADLDAAQTLDSLFAQGDLVLLSRDVTGDGFAMLGAPLRQLGTDAVYFFNQADYSKLDTSAYDRVFLITDEESTDLYTDIIGDQEPKHLFELITSHLDADTGKPFVKDLLTANQIYQIK